MQELTELRKRLNESLEARSIQINSGSVSDFTVYKQIVGERTGLLIAINEINDLLKKSEVDDD